MEFSSEARDRSIEPKKANYSREMVFLAEQSFEGDLKILPGAQWALHYPAQSEDRREKIQGLLEGSYSAEEIAHYLTPDALIFDAQDIERNGLTSVQSRIRDMGAYLAHYDYPRFAQFIEAMRGREASVETLETIYHGIAQARVQKKMMDAYGHTGQEQLRRSLNDEAQRALERIEDAPRVQKALDALKLNWLCEDLHILQSEKRDQYLAQLSGDERAIFETLQELYRAYIQRGDEESYHQMVERIQERSAKISKNPEGREQSEAMEELTKELEPFMDQVGFPGTSKDPAIPPDDEDEYRTPLPSPEESRGEAERMQLFEITPPLAGYYARGRKSYYDIEKKTWSKRKRLSTYTQALSGEHRHTISGRTDQGLKALPLPVSYALDAASLTYNGAVPEFFRDQNGCFYVRTDGACSFTIDFLKEPSLFVSQLIEEDLEPLYRGELSQKTETAIAHLTGSVLHKAEQTRQYILANHFYPGGGDIKAAQALQHKLRVESTSDNYLQAIDDSEYLECYSAHNKFIAMMRKSDVPARLVVGDHIKESREGKAIIDQTTGHAWAEIWDGQTWRRFDATPKPKPEDMPEKEGADEKGDQAPAAQDGGIERPQEQGEGDRGQNQGISDAGGGMSPSETPEANDADMSQAQRHLQEAQDYVQKAEEQKRALDRKIEEAKQFQELADAKKEVERSEMFDDMKEDLEKRLRAKEKEMKDAIKDMLEQMAQEGFIDEQERAELEEKLAQEEASKLDRLTEEIENENNLYYEYQEIKEEIMPFVDQWFRYFVERLPKQQEPEIDEDSLTRQGSLNRRAAMKPRNLIFGTVKNRREMKPSIQPRFLASILVDVSGSMEGEKLKAARKLLFFYSELLNRISQEFGYIRSAIYIFSDTVKEIKNYDQDYDSPMRYMFSDGASSTIKVRLMQALKAKGGTNMLDAIKKAAGDLNEQSQSYPDYASAMYFVGDGDDTCGNATNVRAFLQTNESEHGFGEHMYSAILLGDESFRQALAAIFGDEHTTVAPDFEALIEKSMERFDEDVEYHLRMLGA